MPGRRDGNALLRAVALPTALTLLVLAAIVGGLLHVSTTKSDGLAVARQQRLAQIAVEQSIAAVANDQEASTYWDDAVLRTRERPLDLEWIDNNLGVWFHTYYKHDEAYLLDEANRPIYAMRDGRRVPPQSFGRVAAPVLSLAGTLRHQLGVNRLAPEGATGKTVGSWDVTDIAGRPALISLKPILSETGSIPQAPGSEYLHVSVRYFDASFLDRLSSLYGLDQPRFSRERQSSAALPIRARDGRTIGYITWHPFEPGEQVEDEMAPVLFVALLLIGALLALLLLRIRRSREDLEASRAEAQYLALHDSLTNLPNRALFEQRLDRALHQPDPRVAALMLDLDRFKNVNDTLGHQAGDALIRQFGLRLSALTRDRDTVCRLGGDEFAILIEHARQEDVERLCVRILDAIREPFDIFGAQVSVGVSIGVALSEGTGAEPLDLIRKADIALYRAKDSGRNDYRLFNPAMDESVKLRGTIEEELREAVTGGNGLCVHYQPLVRSDGAIAGLEALLRWDHPMRGCIAPEKFVPIAEDTGLIVPLGDWVLEQACRASCRWPGLFVAINLSPAQLRSPRFYERLLEIVDRAGADARRLQLEVTERVLLDDDDAVRAVLARLRSAGFAIVLDDFGTGYSSLSYLRKFEVDKIKIDGSFVQHLGDADSSAIVAAVLALGQAMGLEVAAEGVETADQRTYLQVAGCKEMQGHYFSRAMPEAEIAALLDASGSASSAA